jgi:xylose isomerase
MMKIRRSVKTMKDHLRLQCVTGILSAEQVPIRSDLEPRLFQRDASSRLHSGSQRQNGRYFRFHHQVGVPYYCFQDWI